MAIEYNHFIHPSDRKAMAALKAIPGFDTIMKKGMEIIGERMFQLEVTSSYLKLGPDQLPEIYNILLKVCGRLGIEDLPNLYLKLDRAPNAATYGDTQVFIVINSGLLETLTPDQVETVIAHECGHILCHHTLYTTMGMLILSGAAIFANGLLSAAVLTSLQYAFYHWMRSSEFSADRVSAFYRSSAEPVVDLMLTLSGGVGSLGYEFSREAFFKQAQSYKEMITGSTYNKVLEFIQFGLNDHPLNAYRAYEVNEFYKKFSSRMLPPVTAETEAATDTASEEDVSTDKKTTDTARGEDSTDTSTNEAASTDAETADTASESVTDNTSTETDEADKEGISGEDLADEESESDEEDGAKAEARESAPTTSASASSTVYSLKIKYEFIKPKGFNLTALQTGRQITLKLGGITVTVGKNETKELRLPEGDHEMVVQNSEKSLVHLFALRYDTVFTVIWDAGESKFSVREDM